MLAWAVVACVWLFAGLFSREPWKADEGYSFGIVLSMIRDGSLLVPTLAGEPFLEKPPLVYWLAALTGWLFEPLLPLHAGARIANALIALATFGLLGASAHLSLGREHRASAWLWLAACPAWFVASRYLTADLGLVLAAALGVNGLVRLELRRDGSGIMLGLAGAVGLLSKGMLMPAVLAFTVLVLLLLRADLRTRWVWFQLGRSLLLGLPLAAAWPIALWMHSPELFDTWFWANNVERFLGQNRLGPSNSPVMLFGSEILYFLPAWPFAVLALFERRRHPERTGLYSTALFASCWVAVVALSATARINYLMPVLVPIALLAAAWRPRGGFGAGRRYALLALASLLGIAILLVVAKLAIHLFMPASRWGNFADVSPALSAMSLAAAFCLMLQNRSQPLASPLAAWVCGSTVVWCTAMALFLKPADDTTSFKEILTQLGRQIPPAVGCVASHGLGETERGLLHYYAALQTRRIEIDPLAVSACPLLIEQHRVHVALDPKDSPYRCHGQAILWEGSRPEDSRNVFRICGAVTAAR